jgi:rare lipoprotein A
MRGFLAAAVLCIAASMAHAETASCYGNENGQVRTATGKPYRPWSCPGGICGAAHRALPFGTVLRVTYQGRSAVVRIDDRGPYHRDRHTRQYDREFDLSLAACRLIGLLGPGVAPVTVETLAAVR